ncbi:MAG: hypothetical protein QOI78_726, partial [Actinomycetota bacterium]|nr:hypothetical protein [Actinomycetota bacterium]
IDVPEPVKGNNVYRPTNFNGIYVSADFGKTWTQMMSTQDVDRPDSGSALVPVGAVPVVGSYLPGVQSWYNEWVAIDPTVQSADGIPTRMSFGLEEVWQNSGTTTPLTGQTQFHVIGRYYAGEVCQLGLVPTVPGVIPCPTSPTPTNTTTHPDQHGAIWIPDGKGGVTLLVGNDGGAFAQHAAKDELMDNTKWGEGRNEDMHTLLPYDAVMAKDGTITAGLQDNGQLKISPSGRQSMIYGGDAFYSAIDPDNSDVIYEEYTYGIMKVTRDGGHTWRSMSTSDEANGNGALFAAPFRMDPLNPNHIVAGGARVMETTAGPDTSSADQADVGSTPVSSTGYDPNAPQWQNVWDLGSNPDGDGFQISAMDVRGDTSYVGACGRCDVLSAGTFNNKLATNVGGDAPPKAGTPAGWHDAKAAGLPQRIINGIAMDPADPKTVYVTLGAYSRRWLPPGALGDDAAKVGTGHVFKSTDAGATFTDITGNLPDASAEAVLVHGDQIVVSTDVGVFTSPTKNGKTWAPLGTGLPNAPVVSMHMVPDDPGTLIAATFGRGVYTYRFADPSAGGPGNCVDVTKPVGAVSKLKRSPGRRFAVRGTASDRGCGASGRGVVKRVRVALVRVVGKRCRYLSVKGRLGHSTSCTKVRLLKARGTTHWVLKLQRHPPHGRYRVIVQVTDSAGNVGTRRKKLVFRH